MNVAGVLRRWNATAWIALGLGAAAIAVSAHLLTKARALTTLTGAVLRQDTDPGKQLPIASAEVSLEDDLSNIAVTDSAGLFHLKLREGAHIGETATLRVRDPDYRPVDITAGLQDRLYVIRMKPVKTSAEDTRVAPMVLSEIRVRYATRSQISVDAGSALKTFEVVNTGDIPCDRKSACSPDGKWKAAIGGAELNAGDGNSFREARVSCIAGPCPFTKIEKDSFSAGGRRIGVTVRNWSDTATFLFEAEVTHTTAGDVVLRSFPAIFDRSMSFTLPASAQGPSIEANLNGEDIVFPLGPTLVLTWATCSVEEAGDGTRLYRCLLKPGYRFR